MADDALAVEVLAGVHGQRNGWLNVAEVCDAVELELGKTHL